jgi:hypothetical protein
MSCESKEELINLIDIHFKDYRWTIDDEDEYVQYYEGRHLCMILHHLEDYKIYININEPWDRNKKRIELEMKRDIMEECTICNRTKKLLYCDECLNQHCYLCHAHIVIKNKGTPVCPFCKDGEQNLDINNSYNNALKKHRYEEALKIIEL